MINSWKTVPLIALADYINGYAFKPEDHTDEGLPIIRIEQLKDDNAELDHYDKSVPEYNLIHNGDLIFSWSASLFLRIWDRGDAILNQHLFKVIPYPDVDKQYLKYCIEYNLPKLSNSSHGSTMKHITRKELKRFHVSLPSEKKEQAKIAEVLATIDRAIAQTEALIAKHQRIKTGLMQDLLTRGIDEHGQLRDPSTHRFKSTPLGMIPEEWGILELEKIVDPKSTITYGVVKPGTEDPHGVLFIRGGDFPDGEILISSLRTITKQISQQYSRTFLKAGDLLISLVGQPGACAVVPPELENGNIARQVALVRLKPNISTIYVKHFILSKLGQKLLLGETIGSVQQVINLNRLKKTLILLPNTIEEQEAINKLLLEADHTIQTQKVNLIKLQSIKTGLMQDLLSGRVSVKGFVEG